MSSQGRRRLLLASRWNQRELLRLPAIELPRLHCASAAADARYHAPQTIWLHAPSQCQIRKHDLRAVGHRIRVVETARPVPRAYQLITIGERRAKRKHDCVICRKLIDQSRACRGSVVNLPEAADSTQRELIRERRGGGYLIEHRNQASVVIHIHRLKRVEHPVHPLCAVEMELRGAGRSSVTPAVVVCELPSRRGSRTSPTESSTRRKLSALGSRSML